MIRKKSHLRRRTDLLSTWLRGGKAIANALGVDRNQLPELVSKHNLPAFKYLGRWTILTTDLPGWMQHIKNYYYAKPGNQKRRPPNVKPIPDRNNQQNTS